jgi:hypothetical protein
MITLLRLLGTGIGIWRASSVPRRDRLLSGVLDLCRSQQTLPLVVRCGHLHYQCGKVKFEAVGSPILTGSCYCTSCQEAGRQFEQLTSAPPVLDPDSGTGLILYRKDRVQCVGGHQYLEEHRLKPDSPTRRVIAKCCNSAMFLDFTKGHWLSMFRNRFPTGAPPLEMRVMTKERRVGVELADDLPNYSGHSGKFMLKLITAWIAMGFRRPEITLGKTVDRAQYTPPY